MGTKMHARVWALRRPWTADAKIGPTWNAYINGAGYWRAGGGRSPFHDRSRKPLGDVGLWEAKPAAELDVTDMLTKSDFGSDLGQRLAGRRRRKRNARVLCFGSRAVAVDGVRYCVFCVREEMAVPHGGAGDDDDEE